MLPWISIETSPIGTARPCCLAREEITDANGIKYDLNKDNLETVDNISSVKPDDKVSSSNPSTSFFSTETESELE